MRAVLDDARSLVATGFRGLRSRMLLTVAAVVLATIAVAAAVIGPMYQSAAGASFLVTRLQADANLNTGVTVDYQPEHRAWYWVAERDALAALPDAALRQFRTTQISLSSQALAIKSPRFASQQGEAHLLAKAGSCQRLRVTGRCPTGPGEMLLLRFDSTYTHTRIGDTISIQGIPALKVVGTYTLRDGTTDYWFDESRFTSVLPQASSVVGATPYVPAPFVVAPQVMNQLPARSLVVRMDRRLRVTPSSTIDQLRLAAGEVAALRALLGRESPGRSALKLEPGNALAAVVAEAQARRVTAQQTVTPAVVSLILVALVLLFRLLAASMELRLPELALAGLRGLGARRLWALGLLEPVLMLAVAAPLGVGVGYVAARLLAVAWLTPGLPVTFGWASVWSAVAVLTASLIVAALVVRSATAEPLSAQIAHVRRPVKPGRWAVLLRLAWIAAAVVVLGATMWSARRSSPSATDLMLPILLAVAAGLVTTLAAAVIAGWWAKRSTRRRGVVGYVASRAIARRREGTWVILPLTSALAIAVFAAGIYAAASNWRASDAATMVGADMGFPVRVPLSQAVALTHSLDPDGSWLMAVGANSDTSGAKVIVDAPRLARVAVWPGSWAPGSSVATVAHDLSAARPALTLMGRHVSMTVANSLSDGPAGMMVVIETVTPSGASRSVILGPYPHGRTTHGASMAFCRAGCEVKGVMLTGPGSAAEAMRGQLTINRVRVDHAPLPYFARVGWRGVASWINGGGSVKSTRVSGSTLGVDLDSHGRQVVAEITPRDVPSVIPVLLGVNAHPEVIAKHGGELTVATSLGVDAQVRAVGTTESTPLLGPAAMLVDYTMYTRTNQIVDASTSVSILARSDTPPSILRRLAAHGIKQRVTLQQVRHTLDQDGYALALNLYLVVTVIVVLLAFAGLAVNMAVQLPARRRDAASLRVVGLPRRSIVAAVASEFTAVLGTAAIAGILAGALSQYVVVRTVTLGYADAITRPRVLPSLDLTALAGLLAFAFALLLCVAILLGSLTIRGARTATLRETAA